MAEWTAPAKLNLDLRIGRPDRNGMHPLSSLVQEIDWADWLSIDEDDDDALEVTGADLPEGGENLVWKAVAALEVASRPRLHIRLDKQVPVAAGLGGGSSDAAAAMAAMADLVGLSSDAVRSAAASVGSDVPFFLVGGTARMEGLGEKLAKLDPLSGFSLGVVVPPFELSTAQVYRRWDELDGPVGEETPAGALPPSLRPFGEVRNDLLPAALDLMPELRDWMDELMSAWNRPVFLTGSGPACFAYFVDEDEAAAATAEAPHHRGARAANLRFDGVTRQD